MTRRPLRSILRSLDIRLDGSMDDLCEFVRWTLRTREGISLGTAHLSKRLELLAFNSRRRTGIARVISPSCPRFGDLVAKMYNRLNITVGVVFNSDPRASYCWFLRATSARAHHIRGPIRGGPRIAVKY